VDIDQATCDAITHLRYYSGEFDIEWARDVTYNGPYPWHTDRMVGFRDWLVRNKFEVTDTQYNYGYHSVGQVDLQKSFGTTEHETIWKILSNHLDIYRIETDSVSAQYDYTWTDADYYQQQIERLQPGYDYSSRG
jgi:flagellar capping protein FliD